MSATSLSQPIQLTIERLEETVLQAFRLWHAHEHEGSPLQTLQVYQQICNRNLCNISQAPARQASNELLRKGLEALRVSHPDEHKILSLRFTDEQTVQVVANRMNLAEGSVLRKQQQGIHHIAEFLYHFERQMRATQRSRQLQKVPASDSLQIWGLEESIAKLQPVLSPGQAPWIVIIEGAAGIGKSTLAAELCRKVLDMDRWEEFAWVSLQKFEETTKEVGIAGSCEAADAFIIDELLKQIAPDSRTKTDTPKEERLDLCCLRLKETAHLLVLDGVEAYPEMERLFQLLNRFTNPSKVLITSRLRSYHKPGAYHFTLGEMSATNAWQMMCQEARLRNLSDVANASESDLTSVYSMIGGNPLAIRLVVEQLHIHTLSQVLSDLATATGDSIAQLYQFLFKEIWNQLDETTCYASLPLLLITEAGDTFEELAIVLQNPLQREELRRSLEIYVKHSLLDVAGTFLERRYVMHHLTRTFLRQQIVRWVFQKKDSSTQCPTQFEQFINETILSFRNQLQSGDPVHLPTLIEKTRYLLEYAFHYETLQIPAINLLLLLLPMLDVNAQPGWLPLFKKALYISQQNCEQLHEAQFQAMLRAIPTSKSSGSKSSHSYSQDRVLPARTL